MSDQDDGSVPEPGPARTSGRRRLPLVLGGAAAALLIALVVVVAVRPASVGADPRPATAAGSTTATTTSRPSAPSTSAAVPAKELPPGPTLSAAEIAQGQAELAEVAARLESPVSLASPREWDQWLPEGKPYPGADTADDMSTCPVLSSRLETVVGQEMSYWTGTLPNGPAGCTWVEIPLSGENNDYDYYISVGFLADGTTVEDFRRYRQGQGTHPCPSADVPAVADGALLVRCASSGVTVYTMAVPDTRLDGGLWVLIAQSKDSTPVRPAEILPVLVDGVVDAFG